MQDPVEPLILDLLEWIGPRPKLYRDVMEAWRTSCPRLPVWEEANSRGFVRRLHRPGEPAEVEVTQAGLAYLSTQRGNRER
jgi:D-3-phosphoglycerate dehydrogenase / 2-oxoglutarate reductase